MELKDTEAGGGGGGGVILGRIIEEEEEGGGGGGEGRGRRLVQIPFLFAFALGLEPLASLGGK